MAVDVDMHVESVDPGLRQSARRSPGSTIVLIGATGAGKSKVGYLLSRLLGYGFIDLDLMIEAGAKQTTEAIFAAHGEAHFRHLEHQAVATLEGLRSHVVAAGGGAVMDDDNWRVLRSLGTTVWLDTPAEEIARRLIGNEPELAKRPLLAEVLSHKDLETRYKLLSERLKALIGNRGERYRQADLAVVDLFSTPESTAHHVRSELVRAQLLSLPTDQKPYDRWHVL